jgi:hyperosmotically inducible periplasmic protein
VTAVTAVTGNVSDIDVTEHVKTALLQLENQAQIDDALKIARASEGAHSIHDELTIK